MKLSCFEKSEQSFQKCKILKNSLVFEIIIAKQQISELLKEAELVFMDDSYPLYFLEAQNLAQLLRTKDCKRSFHNDVFPCEKREPDFLNPVFEMNKLELNSNAKSYIFALRTTLKHYFDIDILEENPEEISRLISNPKFPEIQKRIELYNHKMKKWKRYSLFLRKNINFMVLLILNKKITDDKIMKGVLYGSGSRKQENDIKFSIKSR